MEKAGGKNRLVQTRSDPAAYPHQGLDGAVQRLLEGAPSTPPPKILGEGSADSHPQDDEMEQYHVPSDGVVRDLEQITLEAGPSLQILQSQARGTEISGAALEAMGVYTSRLDAIRWISSQFSAFGFRDEWLADAIFYMDRLAVNMHRSPNFMPLGQVDSPEQQAAAEVMGHQDLWLASVMIALKMSEAESELDSSIQDLVVPLVPFEANGAKCNRTRWNRIKRSEFLVMRQLDSRLVVPTAVQFIQAFCRELHKGVLDAWPGWEMVKLPPLLGPTMNNKDLEEQRKKRAMPQRSLTRLQALAQFLADLALVHRPRRVYGNRLPPEALAIAALQLALHGFGAPPVACEESFLRLQELLAPVPEQELRSLVADVYRLWLRVPADSPIACRWRARGCQMPKAPSQEDLPALLQECCFFQTPQKRPLEPKDHSATPGSAPQDPCASKMRPNPGTPRSEESTSPGSWQSESGDMTASSEMEQEGPSSPVPETVELSQDEQPCEVDQEPPLASPPVPETVELFEDFFGSPLFASPEVEFIQDLAAPAPASVEPKEEAQVQVEEDETPCTAEAAVRASPATAPGPEPRNALVPFPRRQHTVRLSGLPASPVPKTGVLRQPAGGESELQVTKVPAKASAQADCFAGCTLVRQELERNDSVAPPLQGLPPGGAAPATFAGAAGQAAAPGPRAFARRRHPAVIDPNYCSKLRSRSQSQPVRQACMPSDSLERPRKVRRQEKPPQAKGSMPRQDARSRSTSARAQSQSQARDSSVAPKRKALKLSSRPATGPVTRSAASQKAQQLRVACKGTNVRAIQLALQDCEQTCRLGLLKEEKCAAERRIQMLQAEQAKARAAAQGGLVAIMEQQRAESFNEIPLLS